MTCRMGCLIVLLLCSACKVVTTQQPPARDTSATERAAIEMYGQLHRQRHLIQYDNWVREYLTAEWDKHTKDTLLMERAYCLTVQPDFVWGEYGWRGTKIEPATNLGVTAHSVDLPICPHPESQVIVHTHPDQTLYPDGTVEHAKGADSNECEPSDQDIDYLTYVKHKFGVLQCDRRALVAYWPGDRP